VSNAGIFKAWPLDKFALDDLDRMIAINIRAVFVGVQAGVREMRDRGGMITIGSRAVNRIAFPGNSAYSMTKAAFQGLVRGLALDLAPPAITINNVQPGSMATEINPASGRGRVAAKR
jgi:3-oxoacyl-[acyl-carrier protein] reductase